MQTKTVILVDDEPAAINHLRSVISGFEELQIIAEVGDGKSAIEEITNKEPDIVFLDIEMPEMNGFEVAEKTRHLSYQLVFATAYDQYALDAFNTNAIDYLLKPIRPSLLKKCIQKILHQEGLILERLQEQVTESETLVLSEGSRTRVIKFTDIHYIEGIGRYRRIHLTAEGEASNNTDTIISDTTLDDFAQQLSEVHFMRIHRSYLVNFNRVTGLIFESRKHYVQLKECYTKVPVSRSKVAIIKERLGL